MIMILIMMTMRKTVEEARMMSNLISSPSLSSEEITLVPMEIRRQVAKVIFSVNQ